MEDYMDHQTSFETECTRCECGALVPGDNIQAVCAGHVEYLPGSDLNYKGSRVCSCCDDCRQKCIDGAQEEEAELDYECPQCTRPMRSCDADTMHGLCELCVRSRADI